MARFTYIFLLFITIVDSKGIDIKEAIEVGGIRQWITIKGTTDKNPILLFLHGGPGNSAMGYSEKFTGELQKHFLVVEWDQRESGKTAELNASDKPLSVALMEQDALELVTYLQMRFSQNKIYLMGHSWGGFLGLKLSADHPDLFKAYIAVSPMIDQLASERLSLQWMKDKATTDNNRAALEDLGKVMIPFQNGEQLYYHRSWLLKMQGRKASSKEQVETWAKKWLTLFNEASAINFFEYAPEIDCPVYFLVGRIDYQTNCSLTEAYFQKVKAPAKELFWFENAGHNLTSAEPQRLQEIIIKQILPKAQN